ncbi:MAG: lipocalin family protein [Deltaproteobacteria bacterium]|nr:lipocalin family protein [Deltaproteobacteria bacterium]
MDEEAQPGSGISASSPGNSAKSVVGKWELLYQINDKGERQNPKDQTKTQIEFTDNGNVLFNRFDNENSDNVKSRTGKYSIEKNQISITDDAGNTVKWPFQVASDSLTISMPEVNKKFHWRRLL